MLGRKQVPLAKTPVFIVQGSSASEVPVRWREARHSATERLAAISDDQLKVHLDGLTDVQQGLFKAAIDNDVDYQLDLPADATDIVAVRNLLNRTRFIHDIQTIPHFMLECERQIADRSFARQPVPEEFINEQIVSRVREGANCKDVSPSEMHAENQQELILALQKCASCLVRWDCLYVSIAINRPENNAVMGGAGGLLRRDIARKAKALNKPGDLRAIVKQIDPWSVDLDLPDWEIQLARRTQDARVYNRRAVYDEDLHIAYAAVEEFHGRAVSIHAVKKFLEARQTLRTKDQTPRTHPDLLAIFQRRLPEGFVKRNGRTYEFAERDAEHSTIETYNRR